MPEKTITVRCPKCGCDFATRACKPGRFCSVACSRAVAPSAKTPRVTVACAECGQEYLTYPYSPQRYCSTRCWGIGYAKGYEPRFWAMVNKTDSCWLWTGHQTRTGYGRFEHCGRRYQAHRVAWELVHGPIPDGLQVCHNCPGGDNPLCVNPAHVFLGTHQDNMQDAVEKGRTMRGERNCNAKLSADQVREARARFAAGGITKKALAEELGASKTAVGHLINGQTWKHI